MNCTCFIIPHDVLEKLSKDKTLSTEARKNFADTAQLETHWRKMRSLTTPASALAAESLSIKTVLTKKPAITVYDCAKGTSLPGTPIPKPATSSDITAQRAAEETTAVADFYQTVFGRNSVNNLGMTLQSSIHYGVKYNNAFWNGNQMTYGDGDGNIFVDFTQGNDVICHELTHGVTQYTLQLSYTNEAGGLNESISDVFGSMFRQWRANQDAAHADWLIGKNIMGPGAIAKGFTCLRDLSNPAAKHCLAAQPIHYKDYRPGMDPHYSSGIPNFAFYKMAVAIGGKSWEKAGKIWYHAVTNSGAKPNLKMKTFANTTRRLAKSLFPQDTNVFKAVDKAWSDVGL